MPFETQISLASSPKVSPRFLHSQLSSTSQRLPAGHQPFPDSSQTLPSEHACVSVGVLLQSRRRGCRERFRGTPKDAQDEGAAPAASLATLALPYRVPACPSPCPLAPGLTWEPHVGSRAYEPPVLTPGPPGACRQSPLLHSAGSTLSEVVEVLKPMPFLRHLSSTQLRASHAGKHLVFSFLLIFRLSTLCGFQSLAPFCARDASATVCRALTMLGLGLCPSPTPPPLVLA